jgi:uncharacterized phage protein (TIGR01671 family)
MREYKFRIYSFVSKYFIYFDVYEGVPQGIAGGVSEPQEYTGLNDSNGNPIYEGDIVNYKTWVGRHDGITEENQTQVQFKDGAYYPRFINEECEDPWYSFKVYDLKVVGNVFETPHLDENE